MPKLSPFIAPGEQAVVSRVRPANRARFYRAQAGATVTKLISYDPKRISLLILNTGVVTVELSQTQGGAVVGGAEAFPLLGGAFITIDAYTGEIYAISTAPVMLGIIDQGL